MIAMLFLAALRFVGDVQISATDPYPVEATAPIAAIIGTGTVYDVGDVAEHAWPVEYETYQALYPFAVPVPGNHDWYSPGLVDWPWGRLVDVVDQGIHVVGVDTSLRNDPAMMAVLRTMLLDSGLPTVLYLHHPLFSANVRVGAIAPAIRASFLPLVQETGVDLVIAGHSHAYERHEFAGQTFVVVGTGGAHLDALGASATLQASAGSHGWLEVSATASGLDCAFLDAEGRTLDAFRIDSDPPVATGAVSWGGIKALFR